jgi:preprotein translocase subunit SecE
VSNRALRRQKTREPKSKQGAPKKAIPSTGPSRPSSSGGGILSWRPRFLIDIITELRKVVWPSRGDVVHLTIVVVIVTLILGAILGAIDIAFGYIIDEALLN